MSEKNSLDQLATEILFEIFDYLLHDDIIYSFFNINQRFNSIILQYHRFSKYFITPTHHFSFWNNILPIISSRIECLTITTLDFSFSLDLFPNLKSVIISSSLPIYYDQINFILESEQFKKLSSLKIKSQILSQPNTYTQPLFHRILSNENSLQAYECLSEFHNSFKTIKKS